MTNIYNNQLVPYVGRRTLPSVLCTMNIRSLQRLSDEIKYPFYNNSTTIPSNGKNHELIISDVLLKFIVTHRTINELTQWRLLLVKLTGKINESNQYSVVNDNRTINIYNNQLVPYVGRRTLPSFLCTMNIISLQRLSNEIKYSYYNNSTTTSSNRNTNKMNIGSNKDSEENSVFDESLVISENSCSSSTTISILDTLKDIFEERMNSGQSIVIRTTINSYKTNSFEMTETSTILKNEFFVIKSLINNVTSINFEASTDELMSNITTVDHLEYTINLLFEMVFSKPESIAVYLFICSKMQNIKIRYDRRSKTASFKRQLLNKCIDLLHSEMMERKINSKGFYTFIGMLYMKNMLPPRIIVDYLNWSLGKKSDEYVVNMCYFLIVVGKKLEQSNSLKKIMKKLKMQSISSQWNSAINEVTDLRANKWIPLERPEFKEQK
ncbi:eukaryotic translation initiation factor-like [Sipha flava]|uniref:Eukaryotic translation initiation factor-like n=3 Tax=Sipha flava TaxID=143950 RepID=A0A8B8GNS2_9HEMI|nr:eukaryotic translation initiation factor-like [Sipha flava]